MVACPFMMRLSWGCLPVKTERFQIQMSVKRYFRSCYLRSLTVYSASLLSNLFVQ